MRPDGLVKVLDLGLARLLAPASSASQAADTAFATEIGTIVGTAAYMAPEQARGDAVDGRTDIWSLGVTLYEMVAGRSPFEASRRPESLVAILDRDPPR